MRHGHVYAPMYAPGLSYRWLRRWSQLGVVWMRMRDARPTESRRAPLGREHVGARLWASNTSAAGRRDGRQCCQGGRPECNLVL